MKIMRFTFIITLLLWVFSVSAQQLEIPKTNSSSESQIISHTGYAVSYNQTWCIPNWVAYELTDTEVMGTYSRKGSFCPDPLVKGYTAETRDYTNSGWDRGHMAPAADMKWSEQVMFESFYLSNICPQNKNLNSGLWLNLEERVRYWAKSSKSILVACGPIMDSIYETIGPNAVAIPKGFFKVVCRKYNNSYIAIGFIFPNKECQGDIFDYACDIDKVEEFTGHDFFYLLPDSIENIMESKCTPKQWR